MPRVVAALIRRRTARADEHGSVAVEHLALAALLVAVLAVLTVTTAAPQRLAGSVADVVCAVAETACGEGRAGGLDEDARQRARGEELRAELDEIFADAPADGRDQAGAFVDGLDEDDLAALIAHDPLAVLDLSTASDDARFQAALAIADLFGQDGAIRPDGHIELVELPSGQRLTEAAILGALDAVADDAGAVAELFALVGDGGGRGLALAVPDLVGDLGGAPLGDRAAANQVLVQREVDRLERELTAIGEFRDDVPWHLRPGVTMTDSLSELWHEEVELPGWVRDVNDVVGLPDGPRTLAGLERELQRRVDTLETYAASDGPPLLRFDPSGGGRITEVLGTVEDLENADAVGVLNPGVGNDLWNYDERFRPQAHRLADGITATDTESEVVYIANVGYDTPDAILRPSAVTSDTTAAGADEVVGFLAGIRDQLDADRIVGIGHSLGGVITSRAADDAGFDAVALLGPPGAYHQHADDLGIGSDNVYVAMTDDDELTWPSGGVAGSPLIHGPPAHESEFGARRMATGSRESGHTGYFSDSDRALTRHNLAYLVAGETDRVVLYDR